MTTKSNEKDLATFAGGCFWCMEPPFSSLAGVISVTSGYMGGHVEQPTYEQVCSGTTGHVEVIQVAFDPQVAFYKDLLTTFWENIDPTTINQQFVDHGSQYRTAIFCHSDSQYQQALESKALLEKSKKFTQPIVTEVARASSFFPAEEYHQNFHLKSPERYKAYRQASGRDEFIRKVWKGKGSP